MNAKERLSGNIWLCLTCAEESGKVFLRNGIKDILEASRVERYSQEPMIECTIDHLSKDNSSQVVYGARTGS